MNIRLPRILRRVKSIKIVITTDTDEELVCEVKDEQINKIPGLSAGIHGMSSILGFVENHTLEEWYKSNPKTETELQKAIKEGTVKLTRSFMSASFPMIKKDDQGKPYLEEYDNDWNRIKFTYDNEDDLREDYAYCRDFLVKDEKEKKK